MTIEEFLRFLLRNAVLLICGLILGAAAGYGFSYTKPAVYAATSLGYVSASGSIDDGARAGSMDAQYQRAQSYLHLFNTRAVGERIVEAQGLDMNADAVAGSLSAGLDPNAPVITVTAKASSPQLASDIANSAVEAAAQEASALENGGGYSIVPYQTANVPGAPVSPDRERYAAAAGAGGLLLALGFGWLRSRNDSRLRTADDVRDRVGVPVLGVLPVSKDLNRSKSGTLPDLEAFHIRESMRKLRTNLRFVDVDHPPRSIVVTSCAPGEGKSSIAGNLARVLARSGEKTLLIDADLRRPVLAKAFGLDGSVGLSQLLVGSVLADEAIQDIPGTRLSVLPAGQIPPNPSELVGSRRMTDLISELSSEYFIVVDAPPVLPVTDAQLLARDTDSVILVAVPGRTHREALVRAIESISAVGGKVSGVVLNRARTSRLQRLAYGDVEYGGAAYGTYGYGSYEASGYSKVVPDTDVEVIPDEVAPATLVPSHPASGQVPARRRGRRADPEAR